MYGYTHPAKYVYVNKCRCKELYLYRRDLYISTPKCGDIRCLRCRPQGHVNNHEYMVMRKSTPDQKPNFVQDRYVGQYVVDKALKSLGISWREFVDNILKESFLFYSKRLGTAILYYLAEHKCKCGTIAKHNPSSASEFVLMSAMTDLINEAKAR